MTLVKIYSENNPNKVETIEDFASIQKTLAFVNIKIERWQTQTGLANNAEADDILEAYDQDIQRIMRNHGFSAVDVISMHGCSNLSKEDLNKSRDRFLDEHKHSDDEVRFFIDGQGLFCIHEAGKVIQILCKAGDFISVPANTKHWFDMGANPDFKCIRFFGEETGWVANYTGDNISSSFPKLNDILSPVA
ncbi:MAG: cupin domain-containing protein [Candidatus Melainabacteria bacterium]|jgi:1,2-dihydroxy-3-keto-5-methylthiopentene dioxygenase|nr:cupin domain-containing protein [Candidatus Melainabacteria bacterium]